MTSRSARHPPPSQGLADIESRAEDVEVSPRRTTTTFSEARAALGLARWQMRLAVRTGLVSARHSGRIEIASLTAAQEAPDFAARLEAEERLLARQAAVILGWPVTRFREAARAGLIVPIEMGSWRYGAVPYYKRADLEATIPALRAWWEMKRREPHVPDPAARARRRAAAAYSAVARADAQACLETEQAYIAAADSTEAALIAASLWLGRLEDFHQTYSHSMRYATTRAKIKWLAGRAMDSGDLVDRAFEIVAASGHPKVSLTRRPATISFTTCEICAATEPVHVPPPRESWDMTPFYHSQPGCPGCQVSPLILDVVLEIHLTAISLTLPVPLARDYHQKEPDGAGRWTALGDSTPTLHPFIDARRAAGSGRSLPGMDTTTFEALDPTLRAELFAELDGVIDELRAAGHAPTARVPAWYLELPAADGQHYNLPGPPARQRWYGPFDRQVVTFERVVEELGNVLANFPHGFLYAQALLELPGLDL